VDKFAVVNASPLIFFSRSNKMELLRSISPKIFVPEPVAKEIKAKGSQDITSKALDEIPWLEVTPSIDVPNIILDWGLGPGESVVIAMAYEDRELEAIVDDLSARKCASFLQIPVRGTLGIILVAKKRGLIPHARPVIEELILSGMYLSRSIIDEALKRVGE
jgi:predicted nucleic acid-binding protein